MELPDLLSGSLGLLVQFLYYIKEPIDTKNRDPSFDNLNEAKKLHVGESF